MLTEEEEKFLAFWKENREREKSPKKLLSLGLPIGLLIGFAILINYISGWYLRATMVGYSQSTPVVLVIAIIFIALFCSVFYKRHRWDLNEQKFIELTARKEGENNSAPMQHDGSIDSQVSK